VGRFEERARPQMFEAEARWLHCALDAFPPGRLSPLLNLGSSSVDVREGVQTWIENHVFLPLRARNVEVVHVDMRAPPGVDVQADLADPVDVRRLRALRPRALLCCNLLVHVIGPDRLARHCLDLVAAGGLLFVTVPLSYTTTVILSTRCIGRSQLSSPNCSASSAARQHDPRRGHVVPRRGARARVASTASPLTPSRPVPVL